MDLVTKEESPDVPEALEHALFPQIAARLCTDITANVQLEVENGFKKLMELFDRMSDEPPPVSRHSTPQRPSQSDNVALWSQSDNVGDWRDSAKGRQQFSRQTSEASEMCHLGAIIPTPPSAKEASNIIAPHSSPHALPLSMEGANPAAWSPPTTTQQNMQGMQQSNNANSRFSVESLDQFRMKSLSLSSRASELFFEELGFLHQEIPQPKKQIRWEGEHGDSNIAHNYRSSLLRRPPKALTAPVDSLPTIDSRRGSALDPIDSADSLRSTVESTGSMFGNGQVHTAPAPTPTSGWGTWKDGRPQMGRARSMKRGSIEPRQNKRGSVDRSNRQQHKSVSLDEREVVVRSSKDEAEEFEPCNCWTEKRRKTTSHSISRSLAFTSGVDYEDEEDITYESKLLNCVQHRVLPPNGKRRLIWDFFGLIFILYDMVVIPLGLFQYKKDGNLDWATRIYWTIDIPASFFTGYVLPDGHLEMKLEMVAKRYLRTWALLDLIVVTFDWFDLLFDMAGTESARMAKTMRILRMLRVVRLLRMVKIPFIAGTWLEAIIRSEKVVLIAGMFKTMFGIIAVVHLISCVWFYIGAEEGKGGWVQDYGYDRQPLGYQYTTSFHWSLTQFTGTMEIDPGNVKERTYAIIVLLFAFVTSALFISSITSSMTRLQMLTGTKSEMFTVLRQYLIDNSISPKLTMRVLRNAHHAYEEYKRTTPESEIELLELVSLPVRMEMHFELFGPTLDINPFFSYFHQVNPAAARRVCHTACHINFLSSGDVLFVNGEVPTDPTMWFLRRGVLKYTRSTTAAEEEPLVIHDSGWVCEQVLWVRNWVHCGVLIADSECRMLALDALEWQKNVSQFCTAEAFDPSTYAVQYVKGLNEQLENHSLSDVDEFDMHGLAGRTLHEVAPDLQAIPGHEESKKSMFPGSRFRLSRAVSKMLDFGKRESEMRSTIRSSVNSSAWNLDGNMDDEDNLDGQ